MGLFDNWGSGGLNTLGSFATFGLVPDITGSTAASNARDAQVAAAQQANQTQLDIYNQQRADAQPWMTAGRGALTDLQNQMPDLTRKFSMSDFHTDPAYGFDLGQGLQAMQRSAAAKGMLNSTGTMQGLNNYAQNMASNEYGNAYNRFTQNQQQRYNMLAGLSGQGMSATGMSNAAGQNYANNVSANQLGIGNANAAATMQGYKGQMGLVNAGATVAGLALLGKGMGGGPGADPTFGAENITPSPGGSAGGWAGSDSSSWMPSSEYGGSGSTGIPYGSGATTGRDFGNVYTGVYGYPLPSSVA